MNWLSSHKVGHQLNRNVDVQVMYVEYMYMLSKTIQYMNIYEGWHVPDDTIQPWLA